MNKKSLATIQVVDLFGEPIAKAHYEVKNQQTGQLIATGATNTKGCIVEISRDKGTVLDVFIKSMFNGAMLKVQSFSMSKDRMLVKITSPKVLLDLNTLANKGSNGQYKRKTHIVKKGETLSIIAQQNNTTVRALERLNNIDDPNKISIGQVIKLPVHIRLAGFGGALPTDEFTELTAKCIKQFQRDYMGAPETGKICGSLLTALDQFNQKYPIQRYMSSIACPCAKHGGGVQCKGFGAGRKKQYKVLGVEAPGMHRSTMWILKAVHFYLEKEKSLGVKVTGISSGYRCIENNAGHNSKHKVRHTVNHMGGAALDVLISDNRKLDIVREKIFKKYINASSTGMREGNKVFLESAGQGATGWIHFDILAYDSLDINKLAYYGTTSEKLVNGSLMELAKKCNNNVINCSGKIVISKGSTVSDKSIQELVKELGDAIANGEGSYEAWNAGAPEGQGVLFGNMHAAKGTITGKTIQHLLNAST